jgi:hypothetical protein
LVKGDCSRLRHGRRQHFVPNKKGAVVLRHEVTPQRLSSGMIA